MDEEGLVGVEEEGLEGLVWVEQEGLEEKGLEGSVEVEEEGVVGGTHKLGWQLGIELGRKAEPRLDR